MGPRVHSVVKGNWRLTLFHGVEWGELYDLNSDPGEFENLWDAPSAVAKRAELLEVLARREIASVDRAPFPVSLA